MRISDWSSDVCSSDLIVVIGKTMTLEPCAAEADFAREIVQLLIVPVRDEMYGIRPDGHQNPGSLAMGAPSGICASATSASGCVRTMAFYFRTASSNGSEIGRASLRERVCQYV